MNERIIMDSIAKRFGKRELVHRSGSIWMGSESRELIKLCKHLRELGFVHLSAISVTDFIKDRRYELCYFLWSYEHRISLILKVRTGRKSPVLDSVSGIWGEAQIHEREMHELFGVRFRGNHNLSELFLEGWKLEPPFRKDFDWRDYVERKYCRKGRKGQERES
jgi:NADH:ubiquinone oxidoreductase subunit C